MTILMPSLSSSLHCRFTHSPITSWALLQQKTVFTHSPNCSHNHSLLPLYLLPLPNQHHMLVPRIKCAHQLICRIRRSRLQLFRSLIRLHLILFAKKCQTLKRQEVGECVAAYGHDWISSFRLVSLQEL